MNGGMSDYKQDPMSKLLESIQSADKNFRKRTLRFLLDTDRNVENETRIGLTPEHIRQLVSGLRQCGITLNVCVAQAAGIWAGYRDNDFRDAGAEIVNGVAVGRARKGRKRKAPVTLCAGTLFAPFPRHAGGSLPPNAR